MKKRKNVNSTEFQNKFGCFLDDAARNGPIIIERHKRPIGVYMSFDDFEKLTQGNKRAIHPADLSDEDLAHIAKAEVPKEFSHLDELLKD